VPLTIQTIQHLSSLESLQKLELTLAIGQGSLAQHLPFPSPESLIIHCPDWAAAFTFVTAVNPNGSLTILVSFRNHAAIDEYIIFILMQMRQHVSTLWELSLRDSSADEFLLDPGSLDLLQHFSALECLDLNLQIKPNAMDNTFISSAAWHHLRVLRLPSTGSIDRAPTITLNSLCTLAQCSALESLTLQVDARWNKNVPPHTYDTRNNLLVQLAVLPNSPINNWLSIGEFIDCFFPSVVQFHGPYGEDTYSTQWTFVANRLR
jgi:hypothetical protein